MATHRIRHNRLGPMMLLLLVLGLAGCSDEKASPAPASTTVVAVGQPTEASTAVIDPAPVVTEAG